MSLYQIVPYTVKVTVTGSPNDSIDLSDIDGSGLSFIEFVAHASSSYVGAPRRESEIAASSLEIDEVRVTDTTGVVVVSPGTRGIRSRIRQERNGTVATVEVQEHDTTSTPLRHVFFIDKHAKMGLLLVERVGHAGAVTLLNKMLTETMRQMFSGRSLRIAPAMSREAMEAWAEDAKVKSVVLEHTQRTTGETTRKLKGLPHGTVIAFRAPRRKFWKLDVFGGLDQITQLGVLTDLVPELPGGHDGDPAKRAEEMLEEGWRVSLAMSKSGKVRKFAVETKSGVTLTFPAGEDEESLTRPEDDEFMEACQRALVELESMGDVHFPSAALCTWPPTTWDDGGAGWKAVWGVSESKSSASTN